MFVYYSGRGMNSKRQEVGKSVDPLWSHLHNGDGNPPPPPPLPKAVLFNFIYIIYQILYERNNLSKEKESCAISLASVKGHVAWISEKQRLPVKTSAKTSFYGEKLHCGRFYDRLERDYVIYVHIDVNLDGRGWVCCCCSTFKSPKRKWWRSCLKSRPPAI